MKIQQNIFNKDDNKNIKKHRDKEGIPKIGFKNRKNQINKHYNSKSKKF